MALKTKNEEKNPESYFGLDNNFCSCGQHFFAIFGMKPFPVKSSKIIIDEPYCKIEKQKVIFPDNTQGNWFIHHKSDAVVVISQKKSGEFLLQKTYKHGLGKEIFEFCAGMIDSGESPVQAAERELIEETGFEAKEWKPLGECVVNPTGSPMRYHFFLAQDLSENNSHKPDSAEQIEIFWKNNWEEVREFLFENQNRVPAATMSACWHYENFLRKNF